jgi:transposase-like protein
MEKVYGTYKQPTNPNTARLIILFLIFGALIISGSAGLIDPVLSIAALPLILVLLAFFVYKHYTYTREWVKKNMKCPVCGKSISKVSGYGVEGKHTSIHGFILHCESCDKDFALATGPNEYVLKDMNPSLMTVLRATFLLEDMLGFLGLFIICCLLLVFLLPILFIETTFHMNPFNPTPLPIQKSNLTLVKENLCKQSGGGVWTQICCNNTPIGDFPNTCIMNFDKVCMCGLFSPNNPVEFCHCNLGKCWDTNKNACVNAPPMLSNQST